MKNYCPNCGSNITGNTKFCTNCGYSLQESTDETKLSDKDHTSNSEDRLNGGLKVLSFCLPIIGVILYFTNKNSNPKTATSACYSSLWGWGLAVIISVIFFLISMGMLGSSVYENSNLYDYENIENMDSTTPSSDSTSIPVDPQSEAGSEDVDYLLEIMDSHTKSYTCRQCAKNIPWIGSYYWNTYRDENNSLKTDFTELEDLQYAGDDRIDTESYSEENTITRGVFCSYQCAYKNAKKYTENNQFPY